jgi:hypothetical protein
MLTQRAARRSRNEFTSYIGIPRSFAEVPPNFNPADRPHHPLALHHNCEVQFSRDELPQLRRNRAIQGPRSMHTRINHDVH